MGWDNGEEFIRPFQSIQIFEAVRQAVRSGRIFSRRELPLAITRNYDLRVRSIQTTFIA